MKQKHELAQEDYMQGMKYKDIAEKHDVSVNTVKSWKTRYKWDRKGVHTNNEKVRTQKKTGAPIGNKNAVGNSGNKNPKWGNKNALGHGPPKGNDNATTHGLFKKIIPNDDPHAMELLDEIQNHTELDMLFNSIQLQYFNILNSQRIMHVRDKDDMSKEVISESESGEAYMVQFAWDKQANLLTAYARAMNTLTSMIERFNKLANIDDERRLKLEQMKTNIEKTKADTARIKGEDGEEYEDDGFKEALEGKVEEVWDDHDDDSEA
ncbi:TPA: hypothetical protein QCN90_005120 [Bacillus pacificus]|uniref:phage terminase small subunit n=1 Tax=Bacillus cereus group TaxID=86661 RepID=UPI0008075F84|nr:MULTISPECIES: phage terminase small subunit [Bacillus cereus group]OBZ59146.1 hypothetical protein UN66_09330 [Bacillus cereus]MCX3302850.1 phage terminase small subunit [Bacillus pacificus]MCX3329386.1 phage terminase small subunit [Bacillus pacificus]MDA2035472.1 phage terminase small subunit [Bacillus cereus group sp. Bcc02]OJE19652.1 hypothetical protein BAQ45_16925 [Bacillus pacificus]